MKHRKAHACVELLLYGIAGCFRDWSQLLLEIGAQRQTRQHHRIHSRIGFKGRDVEARPGQRRSRDAYARADLKHGALFWQHVNEESRGVVRLAPDRAEEVIVVREAVAIGHANDRTFQTKAAAAAKNSRIPQRLVAARLSEPLRRPLGTLPVAQAQVPCTTTTGTALR